MALVSPGVQVTVTDESQYVPSVASSVPYILIVTAQNKASGSGTGIAVGTLKENANKLYLITSQSDLLNTFGQPFFYNNITGTPINGYELNEYGLLAAYSALGQTSRCYVQRADIDLTRLTASLTRPTSQVADGTLWFDTSTSLYGLNYFNNTNNFTYYPSNQITALNDTTYLITGTTQPMPTYGTLGQIVLVTTGVAPLFYQKVGFGQYSNTETQVIKSLWNDTNNTWQIIGSTEWARFLPVSVGEWTDRDNRWPGNAGGAPANPTFQFNSATAWATVSATANLPEAFNTLTTSTLINFPGIEMTLQSKTGTNSLGNPTVFYRWILFTDPATVSKSGSPEFTGLSYQPHDIAGGPNGPSTYFAWQQTFGNVPGLYNAPRLASSPNYSVPRWNVSNAPQYTNATSPFAAPVTPEAYTPWKSYASNGSIWQIANDISTGNGMKLVMKKYNAVLNTWIPQQVTTYSSTANAINELDSIGGGANIPAGTLIAVRQPYNDTFNTGNVISGVPTSLGFQFYRRLTSAPTVITGSVLPGTFLTTDRIVINSTQAGSSTLTSSVVVEVNGTTAQDFVRAFNIVAPANVSAEINSDGFIVITHAQGGNVYLWDIVGDATATAGINTNCLGVTRVNITDPKRLVLSNWISSEQFEYISSDTAPILPPVSGTDWYYADPTVADIMIQNNGTWSGYKTVGNTIRGENLTLTNPSGPIFATEPPTTQNNVNRSPLVAGDLWIDTSDLDNYPSLYRWTISGTSSSWVKIVNTDSVTPNGILFADARWATNGITNPATDPFPTITSLLTSNYLDLDAPNPALYPTGTLLFNTRRSGYNVKQYVTNYFTSANFPGKTIPQQTATWLNISGNRPSGEPHMGRQAQRAVIIKALKSGIDSSLQVREEQKNIALIACPQYPELAPNMVALNNERNNTSFVIVDTPLRLSPSDIVTWATNNDGTGVATEDGLLVGDPYAATWYPSCLTNDLSGNEVVQPPSHMILRTILRSDYISYPWLASAGTQRGLIDNASQIGYITSSNKFESIGINQGIRDVLYTNRVNPITVIPGTGIVNFGNKTTTGITSALDRINVARLVAYLRGQLEAIAKQYLFEPNDQITRNSVTSAINGLMIDLVAKRALYDYLVVCDLTNNTPARIDRNELWIDIAIEPVKAVEFIYIPVRIRNTGTIQANN